MEEKTLSTTFSATLFQAANTVCQCYVSDIA